MSRKIKKEALYVSAMLTVTATILLFSIILMVLVSSYSYLFNINNVVIAQRDNTSLSNGYNDNNSSSGTIASNRSDDGLITNASSFPPSILSESGIDVNTFPVGIAVNPNTKKVYVANEYSILYV